MSTTIKLNKRRGDVIDKNYEYGLGSATPKLDPLTENGYIPFTKTTSTIAYNPDGLITQGLASRPMANTADGYTPPGSATPTTTNQTTTQTTTPTTTPTTTQEKTPSTRPVGSFRKPSREELIQRVSGLDFSYFKGQPTTNEQNAYDITGGQRDENGRLVLQPKTYNLSELKEDPVYNTATYNPKTYDVYAYGGGNPMATNKGGGFEDSLNAQLDEINSYVGELKDMAQGDYDFIIKFLKREHEMALGTDEQERAKFLEEVADSLEKQIGRIPYDYLTRTKEEKENLNNVYKRNEIANRALEEQEGIFEQQQKFAVKEEQEGIRKSHAGRNLLDSGIQYGQQQKAAQQRQLYEVDPFIAQNRATREEMAQSLAEEELAAQRNMTNIKTDARRGAENQIFTYDKGTESAERAKDKAFLEAEHQGKMAELSTRALLEDDYLGGM